MENLSKNPEFVKLEKRVAVLEKLVENLQEENKMLIGAIKNMQNNDLNLYSTKQVANLAKVSVSKVHAETKLGFLTMRYPAVRKYHAHDIDCWMRGEKPKKKKIGL